MTAPQKPNAFDANSRGIAVLVAAVVIGFVLLLQLGGGGGGNNTADAKGEDTLPNLVDGTTTTQAAGVTTQPTVAVTTTTAPEKLPADITVGVFNGTRTAGLASKTMKLITDAGYKKGSETNATKVPSATTAIYYREGFQAQAGAIAKRLGKPESIAVPMTSASEPKATDADQIIVVVGSDYTPAG